MIYIASKCKYNNSKFPNLRRISPTNDACDKELTIHVLHAYITCLAL